MTSPFRFKYPFPQQTQPNTPSTQLSARNFLLHPHSLRTPSSSSTRTSAGAVDDIDDPGSDHDHLPRKRTRYSFVQEFSSDDDDELPAQPPSATVTPIKRPPVILPQPTPDSPPVDFSPSRRQTFHPNGLAAYTAKIIHEHNALASVSIPHLDWEDLVTVREIRQTEGSVGWICRIRGNSGEAIILLIAPKGMAQSMNVNVGDTLAVSNVIKTESIWICTSWRPHNA